MVYNKFTDHKWTYLPTKKYKKIRSNGHFKKAKKCQVIPQKKMLKNVKG